jgi:hypothetical protein
MISLCSPTFCKRSLRYIGSVSHARPAEGYGKYSALVDLVELYPRFCQLILQLFFDACDVGLLLPRFGGNGRSNRCMSSMTSTSGEHLANARAGLTSDHITLLKIDEVD